MVVRVTVVDSDSAGGLIRRLVQEIEAERVRFESERQQVCIEVMRNSDQALGRILTVVEQWLGDGGRAPTDVQIDEHRYVLGAAPAPEAIG
jgi:hypothetical protein